MRRLISKLVVFIIPLFLFSGCAQKIIEEKKPVKIAINVWPGYAIAYLAQEKGFFKQNGVEVELILKKSTLESLQLYKEGKVDGCFDALPDVIVLSSQGILAKVVSAIDYSESGDVIIATPAINSLSDLKGKTISFEGTNTFSHFFVLKILEKAGFNEADFKFADVKAYNVLPALKKGEIDAGHTWEPTKSWAIKEGYKVLAKAGDIPGVIINVLIFNPAIIQERPQQIRAIIKSLSEAKDYLKGHPEESIKIMAQNEGMSVEEMNSGIKGIYLPDLKADLRLLTTTTTTTNPSVFTMIKEINNFYLQRGQISHIVEAEDIIDSGFIKELSAE